MPGGKAKVRGLLYWLIDGWYTILWNWTLRSGLFFIFTIQLLTVMDDQYMDGHVIAGLRVQALMAHHLLEAGHLMTRMMMMVTMVTIFNQFKVTRRLWHRVHRLVLLRTRGH